MKRVIKFRAWDGKQMWSELTGFEGSGGLMDGVFLDGDYRNIEGDNIHVMQFTGLRDRNGKEIYEGDIVRVHNHGRFQVGFLCGKFTIHKRTSRRYYALDTYTDEIDKDMRLGLYQVIGNIYENPELLEVKP